MTTKELVNTFVRHKSNDGSEYQHDSADPILPFLLADICYQTYLEVTKRIPLAHETKRLDSLWRAAYSRFNKPFFAAYPQDVQVEVTDLMDSLTETLSNDLVILRARIMSIIDDLSFEEKRNEADLLMCYILAEFAQTAWGNVYKVARVTRVSVKKEPHKNPELEQIKMLSFKQAWHYFQPLAKGNIRLSEVKADGIFQQMANHIYKWIDEN